MKCGLGWLGAVLVEFLSEAFRSNLYIELRQPCVSTCLCYGTQDGNIEWHRQNLQLITMADCGNHCKLLLSHYVPGERQARWT